MPGVMSCHAASCQWFGGSHANGSATTGGCTSSAQHPVSRPHRHYPQAAAAIFSEAAAAASVTAARAAAAAAAAAAPLHPPAHPKNVRPLRSSPAVLACTIVQGRTTTRTAGSWQPAVSSSSSLRGLPRTPSRRRLHTLPPKAGACARSCAIAERFAPRTVVLSLPRGRCCADGWLSQVVLTAGAPDVI
ncbi:hypothetical protein PLESTB_000176000 [Pleodorina starrii]|uniref:Uncharacterized protein n=1 Tax=Pleodorina starrii TaxID=330485 RepID=A0A9W6BC53_9CHLO|nr:hypothetical protein PLESTB_000176000 [Pleodorina starrii]